MRAALILAVIFSANVTHAQFSHALSNTVANSWYGWRNVASEVYTGLVEKCLAANVSTSSLSRPGWYGQRALLTEYKDKLKDEVLPAYVNHTLLNGGVYYTSNAATDFVMWDATGACAYAGVQTQYLDEVQWWYSPAFFKAWTQTNAWRHMSDVINVCRWTRQSVWHDLITDTNTVFPGSNIYTIAKDSSGNFDTTCQVAWDGATNAWNTGAFVATNTVSGDLKISNSFYSAVAEYDLPVAGNHDFASQRKGGWSWLAGIHNGFSHAIDIYGAYHGPNTAAVGVAPGEINDATNTFVNTDSLGSVTEDVFTKVLTMAGASTTNYRQMAGPYLSALINTTAANNPLEKIAVDCSDNAQTAQGVTVRWGEAYFLLRWDANAGTGMQWIF